MQPVQPQASQQPLRTMSIASALDSGVSETAAPSTSVFAWKESTNGGESEAMKAMKRRLEVGGAQHVIYQCDSCLKSPLVDWRYRCDQCAEYDLCQDCKDQGKHDATHTLTKWPIDNASARAAQKSGSTQAVVVPAVGGVPVAIINNPPEVGTSGNRPPRRSASGKSNGPGFENSIEKMDDVLARNHVGPLPASHTSSIIAAQFLELYDAGLVAMERHKKARVLEQINARISMALASIPTRVRRGANFVPRTMPEPLEQDIVAGAMAGLTAQLIALDSDKLVDKLVSEEEMDVIDLEKLRNNVEQGVYFRRVEKPIMALGLFSKHMLRVFSNGPKYGAPENICQRYDKLARQALDEVRDAFGMEPQFEKETGKDDSADSISVGGEVQNGSKKPKQIQSTSVNHAAASGDKSTSSSKDGGKDTKGTFMGPSQTGSPMPPSAALPGGNPGLQKKKRKREEEEQQQQIVGGQIAPGMTPQEPMMVLHHAMRPAGTQQMLLQAPMQTMLTPMMTPVMPPHIPNQHGIKNSGMQQASKGTTDAEVNELKLQVKRLREDLDDAHSRIDVLIHLLREKIANPLIRGLDRAGR